MHPSHFAMLETIGGAPHREHHLPGATSEWLFHIGFWAELNNRLGVQFGQYEDDVLPAEFISSALSSVRSIREKDVDQSIPQIQFLVGWDAGGKPIKCTAPTADLAKDLNAFAMFLEEATEAGRPIFCQL